MCVAGSDLDDVVSAEHTPGVSSIAMFSDGALHLKVGSSTPAVIGTVDFYSAPFLSFFFINGTSSCVTSNYYNIQ